MSRITAISIILAVGLLGCASEPQAPVYKSNLSAPSSSEASISGSRSKRSWPADDVVVWVAAVDGLPTRSGNPRAGRATYQQPLVIAAGNRSLTLAFSQGMLFATGQVSVSVQPGASLVVKAETKDSTYMEKATGKDFVLLWAEDASNNQPVSEKVQVFIRY